MDRQQFERIYRSHYHQVVWHAFKLVNNYNVAEEIASDSFIRLWDYRNEHTNEQTITERLFTHTRRSARHHFKKGQGEIVSFEEYQHSIEPTLRFVNEQLSEYDIQQVYASINQLPPRLKEITELSIQGFNIHEIASGLGVSDRTVSLLKCYAYKKLRRTFSIKSTEKPNDTNITNSSISAIQQISIIKDEINIELIKYFAKHPYKIHDIDPNKFEKLVAELMKDMGYNVYHTSQTRDGGRDIIAVLKTPSNDPIITIVECKRHRADRPVGIDIVRSFLYTLREQDKANAGWIVTTSTFSEDALNKQKEYKWLLSLKDNKNLAAWCSNYGQWKRTSESGGLWLPNDPLA
jgi:RNA polymerase sigma factor (sigma-70 family)